MLVFATHSCCQISHRNEAVALIVRVEDCAKSSRGEIEPAALARAAPVTVSYDKAELVVAGRAQPSVGNEDRTATCLTETSWVADIDTDTAVLGAFVICRREPQLWDVWSGKLRTVEEVGEEVGLGRDSGEHGGCNDSEDGRELHSC
jgi:hypothetical protein